MAAKKHTHKYHKVNDVWACALPDCTHFMPKNVESQVAGKRSVCWGCNKEIVLDRDNMKIDKPVCLECEGIDVDGLFNYIESKT